MNKVCAAGTGSFLEEQAEKLGVSIKGEFGDLALQSQAPVNLGERCTVFMESDLVRNQQAGAATEDLVAGLGYSIVHNYLNRVVGTKPVGRTRSSSRAAPPSTRASSPPSRRSPASRSPSRRTTR